MQAIIVGVLAGEKHVNCCDFPALNRNKRYAPTRRRDLIYSIAENQTIRPPRLCGARINHRTFASWLHACVRARDSAGNGNGHSKQTHLCSHSKYSRNLCRTRERIANKSKFCARTPTPPDERAVLLRLRPRPWEW